MSHLFVHKFLVEGQFIYRVVYSVKPVKSVFHCDQDKTFSLRDYLTPLDYRLSRYERLKIFCHLSHTG